MCVTSASSRTLVSVLAGAVKSNILSPNFAARSAHSFAPADPATIDIGRKRDLRSGKRPVDQRATKDLRAPTGSSRGLSERRNRLDEHAGPVPLAFQEISVWNGRSRRVRQPRRTCRDRSRGAAQGVLRPHLSRAEIVTSLRVARTSVVVAAMPSGALARVFEL
jgi:hypothetical protein